MTQCRKSKKGRREDEGGNDAVKKLKNTSSSEGEKQSSIWVWKNYDKKIKKKKKKLDCGYV